MDDEPLIGDVQRKIDRERALIEGAQRMRHQANPSMQSTIDNQIREGRRNIEYLEGRMRELQMRKIGHGVRNLSVSGGQQSNGGAKRPTSMGLSTAPTGFSSLGGQQRGVQQQQQQQRGPGGGRAAPQAGYRSEGADYGHAGPAGYSESNPKTMPARAPFGPSGSGSPTPKARPNYSRLGMFSGLDYYMV